MKTTKFEQVTRKSTVSEKRVQAMVAARVQGITEVKTVSGRIDVLTSEAVYEVKHYSAHNWKAALGQVISYGHYFNTHHLWLVLIGCPAVETMAEVELICNESQVGVQWVDTSTLEMHVR